jgi:outer membrane protein assembly factor BamB
VAISDGLVYASDLGGKVHCLDQKTGQACWVYETKAETWSSPLVADGKIYISTKKKLVVLAAGREMKLLGEIPLGASAYATPVAANGTLFVCSQSYLWAVQKGAQMAGR